MTQRFLRAAPGAILLCLAGVSVLGGCSSVENLITGDKIDYRSGTATRPAGLEVPPDLSQLSRDSRYQSSSGVVSASALQAGAVTAPVAAAAASAVAPSPSADLRVERLGDKRWLFTTATPDQLWPQLRTFWKDIGFTLLVDQPDAGLMETEWAENRAKLPDDVIRRTLGRIVESLYSTGERDKFRTRVERTPQGTEVYISHRGMVEVYSSQLRDATTWQPRPADTDLEAELLSRLMVKLGTKPETAQAAVSAPAPTTPVRARVIDAPAGSALTVDDTFDRAWRRVGLALDRSGFTVEDRDRAQGLYFVRYIDPADQGKDDPGFFGRMFSRSAAAAPARYRVQLKGEGDLTRVAVLSAQGTPETGDAGKRIVAMLVDDLK